MKKMLVLTVLALFLFARASELLAEEKDEAVSLVKSSFSAAASTGSVIRT